MADTSGDTQLPAEGDAANATKRMRDRDVLFAMILIFGSLAVVVYSLSISFQAMDALKVEFYTAPGFFVMIIGGGLLALGTSLLVTALRQGGGLRWLAPASLVRIARSRSSHQTAIVFAYLFLYTCLFWERVPWLGVRVPFWLGTFLFLGAMMITFSRARWHSVLIISGIAALLIDASFRFLARVPLP